MCHVEGVFRFGKFTLWYVVRSASPLLRLHGRMCLDDETMDEAPGRESSDEFVYV